MLCCFQVVSIIKLLFGTLAYLSVSLSASVYLSVSIVYI